MISNLKIIDTRLLKFLSIFLISLVFISCDEGDSGKINEELPIASLECQVLTVHSEESSGDSRTFNFQYEEKGQLSEMTIQSSSSEDERFVLNYSGNIPTTADYYEDGVKEDYIIEFEFDGENLAILRLTYEDDESGETEIEERRFTYQSGKVVIDEYDNNVKDDTRELELMNENVTEWSEIYEACSISVGGVETCEDVVGNTTVTYDDKLNPFRGNLLVLLFDGDYELFFSKNNPVKYVEEYGSDSDESTYTYTYNAQGFPTATTDDEGDEYTMTYQCN